MDAYVTDRAKPRPATSTPLASGSARPAIANMTSADTAGMSPEDLDRLADLQQRAKARKATSVQKLARQRMATTAPEDLAKTAPGQHTRDKALASMTDRGKTGAAISEGANQVMDFSDRADVKLASTAGRIVAGGDAANAMKAGGVLGDLTGRALVANDSRIKAGYEGAKQRDIAASDTLGDAADHLQSLPKPALGSRAPRQADTPENAARGEALMSAFRAAGTKQMTQVQLGVHQDLSMKTGARNWSEEDTLGAQQAGELALPIGHTVSRADADQASTWGTTKRAILTGSLATAGKLSPERKQAKSQIEGELSTEKADRAQEARDARAQVNPSAMQSMSALVKSGGRTSVLTPAHEQALNDIQQQHDDHVTQATQARTTLKGNVDSLRSQQPSMFAAMRDPQAKQQRAALQEQIDTANKALSDHDTAHKTALAGFTQQRKDVYRKAGGGFTSDEIAQRQEKKGQIKQIQMNATAEQRFVAQHAGQEINAHGRVGGIAEATDDASKRQGTRSGAIALGANKLFKGIKRTGQVVGASADDAKDLVQQGEYALGGLTAASALTKEGLATASAFAAPGMGAMAEVPHAAIGGGLKGAGEVGMALTADSAKAHQNKLDAQAVADGSRRSQLRGTSAFTMNKAEEAPSVVKGLTGMAGTALGLSQVSEPIMEATGLSGLKDSTLDTLGIEKAPEGVDPGHAERMVGKGFEEVYGQTTDATLGKAANAVSGFTAAPEATSEDPVVTSTQYSTANTQGGTTANTQANATANTQTGATANTQTGATANAQQKDPWWKRAWKSVKSGVKGIGRRIRSWFS
jgi:hypothetical protein